MRSVQSYTRIAIEHGNNTDMQLEPASEIDESLTDLESRWDSIVSLSKTHMNCVIPVRPYVVTVAAYSPIYVQTLPCHRMQYKSSNHQLNTRNASVIL